SPGERELSPELKAILEVTAVTGTVWHDWESVRELLGFTISQVLEEYETERVAGVGPPRPLPSGETFAELSERILSYLEAFTDGPPFTIQRICEVLLNPRATYTNLNRVAFALEKVRLPRPIPLFALSFLPELTFDRLKSQLKSQLDPTHCFHPLFALSCLPLLVPDLPIALGFLLVHPSPPFLPNQGGRARQEGGAAGQAGGGGEGGGGKGDEEEGGEGGNAAMETDERGAGRPGSPDIAPHSPEFAGFFREVVVEEAAMELGGAGGGSGGGGAGVGTVEGGARSRGGARDEGVGSGTAGGSGGSSGGSGGGEGSGGGDAGSRGRGASVGREGGVEAGRMDEGKEDGEKEERGGSGRGAGEKGEGGNERVREGGDEEMEEEEEASKWLVDNPPPVAFGPVSPTREESREGRREEGREEEKGEEEMKGEGGGDMKVERGGDIRVECEEKAVEGEEDGDGGSGEGEDLAGQGQGKEGGEGEQMSVDG
ncbi:unnamed protein product, partial [Closterium sp. NIES-65]